MPIWWIRWPPPKVSILREQALRGKLPISDIDDAVLRCTACSQPDHCEAWLAVKAGETIAAPPDYCRNHALFNALKRG